MGREWNGGLERKGRGKRINGGLKRERGKVESGGRSREGGKGRECGAVPSKFKKNFLSSTIHQPALPWRLSAAAPAASAPYLL
jgi:hypothetical protein